MVDAENEFAREQLRLRGLLQDHIASFARRDGNVDNSTRVVSASDGVVPRYIRIRRMASEGNNVGANKNHEEEEHTVREAVLAAGGRRVPWCPPYASESFYALPPEFRIAQWPLYQQGKVYGMDVASGVAVWALGPRPGDNVLDLCCCPGLKLCMVAEQMHHTGTITGMLRYSFSARVFGREVTVSDHEAHDLLRTQTLVPSPTPMSPLLALAMSLFIFPSRRRHLAGKADRLPPGFSQIPDRARCRGPRVTLLLPQRIAFSIARGPPLVPFDLRRRVLLRDRMGCGLGRSGGGRGFRLESLRLAGG
jgi:hypothetical protein